MNHLADKLDLKLLVIGIDGASSPLMEKLMQEGNLPAFASMCDNGLSSVLESTFPPHTAPGWPSAFTGVNPGKHGIYQFWKTQQPDYQPLIVTALDMRREPLWKILERRGLRVGVVNVPMTHPPTPLAGGYMISWPLSATLHYCEPKHLIKELANAGHHHHSDIITMYRGQEDYIAKADTYLTGRTDSIFYLQKTYPVDCLIVVYTEIDRISHHFWGEHEAPSEWVTRAYRFMDRELGRLLEAASPDTFVVALSDHGFGVCNRNLNVPCVLESAGLLKTSYIKAGQDTAIENEIGNAHLGWFSSSASYRKVIDWDSTKVYMPTPGCFGLNFNLRNRQTKGIVSLRDIRHITKAIKQLFQDLKDPAGTPYFEVVDRAEIYSGNAVLEGPDLILKPNHWDIMPHTSLKETIWSPPSQQAIHRMEGIFAAVGPNIEPTSLPSAHITDVTPFILAQLDIPIPEDIDGHWLLDRDTPATREPAVPHIENQAPVLNSEEQALIEKRLQNLGYL